MTIRQAKGEAEAIASLIGTIIGAGVFTLPYMAVHSGLIATLLWLVIVGVIVLYLHLIFGEIVLRTKKDFRLPGYVGHYLGEPAKKFMLITTFLTFSLSLLAYLLLGTQFLATITHGIWPMFSIPAGGLFLLLWLILSIIILGKGKVVSRANFILSFLLVVLFIVIIARTLPAFSLLRLNLFPLGTHWNWLIPYGVMFFALNGMIAVPEAAKMLRRHKNNNKSLKKVIIWGTIIPLVIYLFFILIVAGASGRGTTIETMRGLQGVVGPAILFLGASLGLLAVITSYLIFANYIKNSFQKDFSWSPFISYFLVLIGPISLYFLHLTSLLKLFSFLGGMLGGLEGIMLVLVFKKVRVHSELKPAYSVPFSRSWLYILLGALLAGALCQTFLAY